MAIKFDLDRAKRGDRVLTRDGKPARIICFDCNNQGHPVVALITFEAEYGESRYDKHGAINYEMPYTFDVDGHINSSKNPSASDLVMAD